MPEKFANQAQTTLAAELPKGSTTLTVSSATAFPTSGEFRIVIGTELLKVKAVEGTKFTVERAIEGSTEAAHAKGATVLAIVTAEQLTSMLTGAANPEEAESVPVSTGKTSRAIEWLKQTALVKLIDKWRGVYNVKAYGAKGDGVTADSTAILAATTAAEAAGGIVWFPPGTYIIDTTILVGAGIRIKGAGWTVVLKAKAELNAPVIESKNFATTGSKNGAIEDLIVDGNKANNTAKKDGIRLASQNWYCRNVISRNCIGAGFSNAILSESEKETAGLDNNFFSCRAINCEGWGFYIEAHDTLLLECDAIQCKEYGFHWATNGYAINCHSWCYDSTLATATKTGWRLGTTVRCINCIAEGATERQVQFVGNGSRWIGGEVFNGISKPNATLFEFNGGASIWIDGPYCHEFGTGGAFKFTTNGQGSTINAQCFDSGSNQVTQGTPHEDIKWSLGLGGTTALGEAAYNKRQQYTFIKFAPGTVPNNTLYVDSVSGLLKLKDNTGALRNIGTPSEEAVASANTVTITNRPSLVKLSGSTEVKKITATFAGHKVTLIFTSTAKLVKGENLIIASTFEGGANRTITLVCDGTNWYEMSRSVN